MVVAERKTMGLPFSCAPIYNPPKSVPVQLVVVFYLLPNYFPESSRFVTCMLSDVTGDLESPYFSAMGSAGSPTSAAPDASQRLYPAVAHI